MKTKTMHFILVAGFVLAGLINPVFGLAGGKADSQAIVDQAVQDVKTVVAQETRYVAQNKKSYRFYHHWFNMAAACKFTGDSGPADRCAPVNSSGILGPNH